MTDLSVTSELSACARTPWRQAVALLSAFALLVLPVAAPAEPLEFEGRIEAVHQADVYSRAEGIVAEVTVTQGDYVEVGTPLVLLQDDVAALSVTKAAAELARAEALLTQARSRLARAERLTASGSGSEVTLLEAQTALALASADHTAAEAGLTLARTQLEDTVIRAPIAGYVEDPKVRIGSALEFNSGDPPLFQLVGLDPVRVVYDVPYEERLTQKAASGAVSTDALLQRVRLQIALPSGPVLADDVVPDASAAWVDPELGTIRVWATVENAAGVMRPGMRVRVTARVNPEHGPVSQ